MITEQYVTFQTAQLLKEAGFNEICDTFYSSNVGAPCLLRSRNSELDKKHYSRPTQALAARWLRDVYHIYITQQPTMQGWMFDLFDLLRHQYILCGKYVYAGNYEEALEEGLKEALELIINNKRNEQRNH